MFVDPLGPVAGRSSAGCCGSGAQSASLGIRRNRFWKRAIFYPAVSDAQHAHNLKSTDLTIAATLSVGPDQKATASCGNHAGLGSTFALAYLATVKYSLAGILG